MTGATYDAGALIAAERGTRSIWNLHSSLLANGVRPTLSTAVLGQVWRGGPQARLSRFLRGCRVVSLEEDQARTAGAALARGGTEDLIDAVVVVGALARGEAIVTSDVEDLRRIASALGEFVALHQV